MPSITVKAQLVETERIEEYQKRNYSWPIQQYIPPTEGWKQLMDDRLRQIAYIDNDRDRYEGYLQTISAALLAPNFTEHGFGLARCPQSLINDLRHAIRSGVGKARLEKPVEVIEGPTPWFIDRPDLTRRVLRELQHYAETWAGMPLTPYIAYGFRLYRNESALWMHVDKMQTHIISFILHIDSADDAEPWPIFIEDFQGRTHEVILTPGDILFYESSKCFHGRPRKLNGSWYSSVFVHYYPKYGWQEIDHKMEAHYAVPPVWSTKSARAVTASSSSSSSSLTTNVEDELVVVSTGFREPNCPDNWCRTKNTVKWSGPGEEGYWIDPNFVKHEFNPHFVTDEL